MAVCYFNDNYDKKYKCEYENKNGSIEVTIEYDIISEIELTKNGIRMYGTNTKFKERDILIIDSSSKTNYLLKDANYYGHNQLLQHLMGKL